MKRRSWAAVHPTPIPGPGVGTGDGAGNGAATQAIESVVGGGDIGPPVVSGGVMGIGISAGAGTAAAAGVGGDRADPAGDSGPRWPPTVPSLPCSAETVEAAGLRGAGSGRPFVGRAGSPARPTSRRWGRWPWGRPPWLERRDIRPGLHRREARSPSVAENPPLGLGWRREYVATRSESWSARLWNAPGRPSTDDSARGHEGLAIVSAPSGAAGTPTVRTRRAVREARC